VGGVSSEPALWWRSGVIYQVYVRSFADSDGDGVGDLQGVIDHLDHLAWLGIDAMWLSPISPTPNADWGYDVSDYTDVDPELGDLERFDRLVAEADARGIRVILDFVPNHTSDRHPWFLEARSDRAAPRRDWYVWADPGPGGSPPNNWMSSFGGPAWTFDVPSEQYYLHNFLPEQPDLNWWNEDVRRAFDEIQRFWYDRGVAGFRIDVANGLVKDRDLRDNPPVTDEDHPRIRALGLRPVYNLNRSEVHDVFRTWRKLAEAYRPPRLLLGETWVLDLDSLMRFYGDGDDELHLAINFPFLFADLGAGTRAIVESTEALIHPVAWPAWGGSNHDAGRFPTRWCGGDEQKIRTSLLLLLTLRGTPLLYYGDEIGMEDVAVPRDRLRDPVGIRRWPEDPGRDGARTPIRWTAEPSGGFTRPGVEPWLPMGGPKSANVADQRADPGSVLRLCRDLIALRRARSDLHTGAYAAVEAPAEVWGFRRGEGTVVLVNCSERKVRVRADGTVLLSTSPGRQGERPAGVVSLRPWEGLVLAEGGADRTPRPPDG
jgi:alpha-glucosidase